MESEKRLFDPNMKIIDKHFNKRLIDANALKELIFRRSGNMKDTWSYSAVLLAVECQPTVDAVEVVHGRWEWYEALVNPYALCSNCGCGLDKRDALNFAYCPYCGAKMDGDWNGSA